MRHSFLHKCKDGRTVDIRGVSKIYPPMSDEHLLNTIEYIKRRAKEGVRVCESGGYTWSDAWYSEDTLFGKEAKEHLNYQIYKREAKRRGLIKKK